MSLQGALGGLKQDDDDDEWEQVPKSRGSMGRTRQHNRSAQRRYREKQKVRNGRQETSMLVGVRITCLRCHALASSVHRPGWCVTLLMLRRQRRQTHATVRVLQLHLPAHVWLKETTG